MHVQVDPNGVIIAHGTFTADHSDPSIRIIEVSDDDAVSLAEPGVKALSADGTIVVTPPDTSIEDAARAAAEAQRQADTATLMAALPTQEAREAMARLLRLA